METSFHWAGPGQDPVVAALAIEVVTATVCEFDPYAAVVIAVDDLGGHGICEGRLAH